MEAAFFNTEAIRLPPYVMVNQGLAALRTCGCVVQTLKFLENYRYAN